MVPAYTMSDCDFENMLTMEVNEIVQPTPQPRHNTLTKEDIQLIEIAECQFSPSKLYDDIIKQMCEKKKYGHDSIHPILMCHMGNMCSNCRIDYLTRLQNIHATFPEINIQPYVEMSLRRCAQICSPNKETEIILIHSMFPNMFDEVFMANLMFDRTISNGNVYALRALLTVCPTAMSYKKEALKNRFDDTFCFGLDYIKEMQKFTDAKVSCYFMAYANCCMSKYSSVETLDYLNEMNPDYYANLDGSKANILFSYACKYGTIDMVRRLHQWRPKLVPSNVVELNELVKAKRFGILAQLKEWDPKFDITKDTVNFNKLFNKACTDDDCKMVEFLMTLKPQKIITDKLLNKCSVEVKTVMCKFSEKLNQKLDLYKPEATSTPVEDKKPFRFHIDGNRYAMINDLGMYCPNCDKRKIKE